MPSLSLGTNEPKILSSPTPVSSANTAIVISIVLLRLNSIQTINSQNLVTGMMVSDVSPYVRLLNRNLSFYLRPPDLLRKS